MQLRVELPDAAGRRDIFRIHTRQMRETGGLSQAAEEMIEDLSEHGLAAKTEKFTGAEIAGKVKKNDSPRGEKLTSFETLVQRQLN